MKSLFAAGNFRDVRVDASPAANGVSVTFVLYLNYRIGKIVLEGTKGSERTRATHELRVHSGDVLSLSAVDSSAVAVQEQLKRDGYLESTVDPETTFVSERNVADVAFHVTEGPQAKVASVVLDGDIAPFTQEELTSKAREKPGKPFRLIEARGDADRMKNYLVRRDYRRADVTFVNDTYDAASKTVTLHYKANAGPIVKVEVTGVTRGAVRKVLPFAKNQEYSEDLIDRAADDIVKLYQERGYLNAAVDTESHSAGNTWVTTFNVKPGEQYKLSAVTFTGNIKVPDKTLAKLVQTAPAGGIKSLIATIFRRPTGIT